MRSEKKNSELEVNRGEKHELVVNPFVKKNASQKPKCKIPYLKAATMFGLNGFYTKNADYL
jgi:hypothetical protein